MWPRPWPASSELLVQAKRRLPHGEYLPWVQQACGLKPQYAQKLIKTAELVNAAHCAAFENVADTTTLFLLSADTTTEDVREWFMERAAAGELRSDSYHNRHRIRVLSRSKSTAYLLGDVVSMGWAGGASTPRPVMNQPNELIHAQTLPRRCQRCRSLSPVCSVNFG